VLIEPEISAVSIILIGSFNPKIFSPDWFARHGLITEQDAEDADLGIVHPDITQFRTTNFMLGVEHGKFSIQTTQAPYVRIKDLTTKIFGTLLPHTPISILGINREVHINLTNQKLRDKIGYTLAPPDAWGKWAPEIVAGEGNRHGGMLSVTMQVRALDDRARGHRQATVQPSFRIPNSTGIFIQVNDQFELEENKVAIDASEIIAHLDKGFDASIREAEFIIDQVTELKNGD